MPGKKPTVKTVSFKDDMVQPVLDTLADGMRWVFGLSEGWQNRLNLRQNNFDLGVSHLKKGNISDAVFRFTIVTWLEPQNAAAWYYLGRSQIADGKTDLGIKSLNKSLQLQPKNEEARYLLAVADGAKVPVAQLPRMMPRSLSQDHFELLAETHDSEQLDEYKYKGHIVLADAVRSELGERANLRVLELGVGTGLCGARLRDKAVALTGADFSASMVGQAQKRLDGEGKPFYDTVVQREAHEFLREASPESYDVIIAAGLFSYVGDVSELIALAHQALTPGGILGFTADLHSGQDYQLLPAAGRFGFSETYLRELSRGFSDAKLSQADVYPEFKAWLGVWRK